MPQKSKGEVEKRSRYWGFLVYPESISQDWEDILTTKYGFEWVRSPLHDKDLNEDKTFKKPHYHCLIYALGKKSYSQIKAVTDEIKATAPQIIHNAKGNVRYMAHLDNPEKAQYKISDLKAFNGFDIENYLEGKEEQNKRRLNAIKDILEFIEEQGLTEITEVLQYASKNEPYWFELICNNSAYIVNCYLKSKRYQLEKDKEKKRCLSQKST